MSLLDIDERILDLIKLVDFDKSPINDLKDFTQRCAVGIIEGACSTSENVEVLKAFRDNCDVLVAIGECALTGGVPSLRNTVDLKECLDVAFVRGISVVEGVVPDDPELPVVLDRVYPCHEVVKIDYMLPGCPPQADTLWQALTALLAGQEPALSYDLVKYD
jgi:NAD-reducing hydrogenase small subunit